MDSKQAAYKKINKLLVQYGKLIKEMEDAANEAEIEFRLPLPSLRTDNLGLKWYGNTLTFTPKAVNDAALATALNEGWSHSTISCEITDHYDWHTPGQA